MIEANRRIRSRGAAVAGWLAAAALLITVGLTAYTGPGFSAGWIAWPEARSMLEAIGYAALSCIALGALAVVWNYLRGSAAMTVVGAVTLIVGAVLVMNLLSWRSLAASVPLIHDITTDTEDPPQFVDVVPLRADAPNPPHYNGEDVASQQRAAYPDIVPIELEASPARAFAAALAVVDEMGWELVAEVADEGRIEATATTRYMRFKDDVVIRVRASDGGSVVDVRSKSRMGLSDLGTNARRIRDFRSRLLAHGTGQPS